MTIVNFTRRRFVWMALAALSSAQVRAQEPAAMRLGGLPTAPAAAGARLNQLFDAEPARAALSDRAIVAAPRMSEKAPAPALPQTDNRPAAARLHQELVVPVPVETPAYRRTFRLLLADRDKTDRYDELIILYARKYRLDARFLKSIMAAESEFDPRAHSPAGARGLMQVMPVTSEGVGVPAAKLYDPAAGIKAGAAYIQELFKAAWRLFHLQGVRYTDCPHWVMQRVIAAYHAGPKYLTRNRWFATTRAYVKKVVLYYHSQVTDLRRAAPAAGRVPSFAEAVVPGGTLY